MAFFGSSLWRVIILLRFATTDDADAIDAADVSSFSTEEATLPRGDTDRCSLADPADE